MHICTLLPLANDSLALADLWACHVLGFKGSVSGFQRWTALSGHLWLLVSIYSDILGDGGIINALADVASHRYSCIPLQVSYMFLSGGCSSGGIASRLLIERSLVWILVPPCWSELPRSLTQIGPDVQLADLPSVYEHICEWVNVASVVKRFERSEKHYINTRLFTLSKHALDWSVKTVVGHVVTYFKTGLMNLTICRQESLRFGLSGWMLCKNLSCLCKPKGSTL